MKKRTTKLMALFTVLSIAAVSCDKENLVPTTPAEVITDNQAVYIYQYDVDGIRNRITLRGEVERDTFISRMIALAEKGHRVSFFDETRTTQLFSKETVTYSTKDKDKAKAWSKEMLENGYEVIITYNPQTGYYDCTATK